MTTSTKSPVGGSNGSQMDAPGAESASRLMLYATPEHPCSYLPGKTAITLFADPSVTPCLEMQSALMAQGFRRSGEHLYRPCCPSCDSCVATRVPVDEFIPNRSQRRTWQRNQDLHVEVGTACYSDEYFALYRKYQRARHAGGSMDTDDQEQFSDFLTSSWSRSYFAEFRLQQELVAVAVFDELMDGLSAVYSFFDPEQFRRGLGVHCVLWEIELARKCQMPWLYLGYWIAECEKMSYKCRFRPQEHFRSGRWERDA